MTEKGLSKRLEFVIPCNYTVTISVDIAFLTNSDEHIQLQNHDRQIEKGT